MILLDLSSHWTIVESSGKSARCTIYYVIRVHIDDTLANGNAAHTLTTKTPKHTLAAVYGGTNV